MEKDNRTWNDIESLISEYNDLKLSDLIDYKKFYLYSIISHSTAIEGSTLTEAETQILLDEGLTAKGKPLINGRMARLIMNYIQFYHQQIPSKIYREDKSDYILSLRTSQDSNKPEAFRSFMLMQQKKMLKEEIFNFKTSQKKGFSFMF